MDHVHIFSWEKMHGLYRFSPPSQVFSIFSQAEMGQKSDNAVISMLLRLRPLAKDVRIQITNQWAEQRWTQLIQDRSAAP